MGGLALFLAPPSRAEPGDSPNRTVIDRESLLRSGAASVADYLRAIPFNSFGSFRPQSNSTAQSWAELSLRGLGARHTLILIDGRRAPIAPSVGFGQDLNAIPLAAVERIEITTGVTAIHGSDAAGGVVNIVTRKDFNGVELSVGAGRPPAEGGETEEGSVLFGNSSERGSVVVGASYANRGIVYDRDRPWYETGISTFSNNFRTAIPAFGTPSGFAPSGFVVNPSFGSVVPGGCAGAGFSIVGSGAAARCRYDFNLVAANDVEIQQSALFARARYVISDDWSAYLNARASRVESFGRVAAPPSSPWPGGDPFIPVGSPNHPAARFPGRGYDAARPYFVRHRFAAVGPRDTTTDGNDDDFEAGFRGQIGNWDVAVGARLAESEYRELGRGFVVPALAQQLIASGAYDIYAPFANSRAVLDSMTATINREASHRAEEVHAEASLEIYALGSDVARLRLASEFRAEDFADSYDTLQTSGQVVLIPFREFRNTAAGRDIGALTAEAYLPISERLSLDIAARSDRYSDVGWETSGHLALRFEPRAGLSLHAAYGWGFSAPPLAWQGIEPVTVVDTIVHRLACFGINVGPCFTQVYGYIVSDPDLRSERSGQASMGLAWTATRWLTLSLSYFDTRIEDRIQAISSRLIVDCLLGEQIRCPRGLRELPANTTTPNPQAGFGFGYDASRNILYTQRGYANFGTAEVSGADLALRTRFEFGELGAVGNRLLVSWLRSHESDAIDAFESFGKPRTRATLANDWAAGDFSASWNIHYIHGTRSAAGEFDDRDFPARLPSWTTHDLQASWSTPWNGQLTLGVNNVADRKPVRDPVNPTGRGYDFALYDGYGRVPYIRYRQAF